MMHAHVHLVDPMAPHQLQAHVQHSKSSSILVGSPQATEVSNLHYDFIFRNSIELIGVVVVVVGLRYVSGAWPARVRLWWWFRVD